jgi:hypothetical protein
MKLPKNNYELTKFFKNARTPNVYEFCGEYFVDMLTVLPSLRKFSHRKVFYIENDRALGYNLLFTNKIWGHFFLEDGICAEIDSSKVVVINYDRLENSFISNRIRDYVKCIDDTLYIGRFNYLFMGKPQFLGYFSLTKVK